ncbi:MAG: ABC transporter permease [Phycisphaerales bacterium]|nr:ABC transporter permease [Phycisphaerales bacterium]
MSMSDMTIVTRSLRVRLLSTVITVLSVACAAGLLIVLLSLRHQGQSAFSRGTGNAHVLVSAEPSGLVSVLNTMFYAQAPKAALDWKQIKALGLDEQTRAKKDGSGEEVVPSDRRLAFSVPVQMGDSFRGFKSVATTGRFFGAFQPTEEEAWAFAAGKSFEGTWEVVLGAEVAKITGLKVGSELFITHGWSARGHGAVEGDTPATKKEDEHDHSHGDHDHDHDHDAPGGAGHIHDEHPFVVTGILQPTGTLHDRAVFMNIEAGWVLHAEEKRKAKDPNLPEARVDNLTDEEKQVTGVLVRARSGAVLGEVFAELRKQTGVTVANPASEVRTLFSIISNVDTILLAVAGAVLVGSAASVMLAVYSSMNERRKQIAVLRVLGASRGRITGLVLAESAVIALLGAAAGAVLSVIGMQAAAAATLARTGVLIGGSVELGSVVMVMAGTVGLGMVAGLVPGVLAYRVGVGESLRE